MAICSNVNIRLQYQALKKTALTAVFFYLILNSEQRLFLAEKLNCG